MRTKSWIDEMFTEDERALRGRDLVKHLGPGNHPNGSPQTAHAGGGSGPQSWPFDDKVVDSTVVRSRLIRAFGEATVMGALSHLSVSANVPTAPTQRTLDTIASVYNGQISDRFGTRISDIKVMDDGTMQISGHLLDLNNDGEVMGTYTRTFEKDIVRHDYLGIQPDWQGLGAGKALTDAAEAAYIDAGFNRIYVEAGLAVGGYAWARAGYRFRDVPSGLGSANHPIQRVKSANSSFSFGSTAALSSVPYRRLNNGDVEMMTGYRQWEKAADGDDWDALSIKVSRGTATPQDIAVIGQEYTYSGNRSMKRWLGKDILMGSDWWGVKHLNPATDAPVAKSWLDEEFPRRAAGETEDAYLARLAATAPADIFDGEPGEPGEPDGFHSDGLQKHKGPGNHPNGSPQSAHAGGGGAARPTGGGEDGYLSSANARIRLAMSFPNARIDLDDAIPLESEALEGVVLGLERMAEKFPKVAAEVVLIRNGDLQGADAQTDWVTTRVNGETVSGIGFKFSPKELGREALIDVKVQEYLDGETFTAIPTDHLRNYAEGVAVHEFGHAVHNTAVSKVTGAPLFVPDIVIPGVAPSGVMVKNEDLWMEMFGYDRRMPASDAAAMFGASNYHGTEAGDWGYRLDEVRMPMAPRYPPGDFASVGARRMSEYATTNRAEQVAEAFQLRHGPRPAPDRIPPETSDVLDEMEQAVR